jgi:hypothetical protein
MTDLEISTKDGLKAVIDRGWKNLSQAIDRLDPLAMTRFRDAQGWNGVDHLLHLAAWERSVVFFLQGKPRHEGLGIEKAVYLDRDFDAMNAVIQAQGTPMTLDEARKQLEAVHADLMRLFAPLSDADLLRSYRGYLPDEPGIEGEGRPAFRVIYANTTEHYIEHLEWIEQNIHP